MTDAPLIEHCATYEAAIALLTRYCGGVSYFNRNVALLKWSDWTPGQEFRRRDESPYPLALLIDAHGYELCYVRMDGRLGQLAASAAVVALEVAA